MDEGDKVNTFFLLLTVEEKPGAAHGWKTL